MLVSIGSYGFAIPDTHIHINTNLNHEYNATRPKSIDRAMCAIRGGRQIPHNIEAVFPVHHLFFKLFAVRGLFLRMSQQNTSSFRGYSDTLDFVCSGIPRIPITQTE